MIISSLGSWFRWCDVSEGECGAFEAEVQGGGVLEGDFIVESDGLEWG
jgi:hypothetical protein